MTGEPRYFLTAYGIAVKHGYQGTEEEWLTSLTAYGMAVAMGYEGTAEEWLQRLNDPVPALSVGEVTTLAAGLPARVEISGDKEHPVLNFGIPRGEGTEDALMKTGGTMSGALSMGGNPLRNVPAPQNDGDAVNKTYVDAVDKKAKDAASAAKTAQDTADAAKDTAEAALPKSGGTVTGALTVPDPTQPGHAANMGYVTGYVDSKRKEFQVTLTADGWTGAGPYVQTLPLEGILSTDRPHFGAVYDADLGMNLARKEGFALVDDLDTGDGTVTFTCFEEKPTVSIPIQMEVNR